LPFSHYLSEKTIGIFHQRLGPNKLSFTGLLQPLLDALKLFLKRNTNPILGNKKYFDIRPQISLAIALMIFRLFPTRAYILASNYSFMIFIALSSTIVLIVLFAGWASNAKYSLLGSLRRIAQSISYEAVLSTLILLIIFWLNRYSIDKLRRNRDLLIILLLPIWIICFLGETHRAPFDFGEAESELVSGFNTEYSGSLFAFLFLREHTMILFGCLLISNLLLPKISI